MKVQTKARKTSPSAACDLLIYLSKASIPTNSLQSFCTSAVITNPATAPVATTFDITCTS